MREKQKYGWHYNKHSLWAKSDDNSFDLKFKKRISIIYLKKKKETSFEFAWSCVIPVLKIVKEFQSN